MTASLKERTTGGGRAILAVLLVFATPLFAQTATVPVTPVPSLPSVPISPQAAGASKALDTALGWLANIDRNDAQGSYAQSSALLKRNMTPQQWQDYLQQTRTKRGAVVAREWFRLERTVNPANLPKGEYVMVFFLVNAERSVGGAEQVSLVLTNAGWMPTGYVVLR